MDPMSHVPLIAVWSSTEIATAVVALCMPSLKPIFDHLLSDSPTSSDQNSPKHSANLDDSAHMVKPIHRQKHQVRIPTGEIKVTDTTFATVGVNYSEGHLWVDGTIVSAELYKEINSSSDVMV
jgi:hypothetical protein